MRNKYNKLSKHCRYLDRNRNKDNNKNTNKNKINYYC